MHAGLTKMSRDTGTPTLGPVSHQVDLRDGLGAITVSDAVTETYLQIHGKLSHMVMELLQYTQVVTQTLSFT